DELESHAFQQRVSAAAPPRVGRARKASDRFVKVPLWWIETAAKDIRSPATLVLIELLYAAWKAKSSTFPLPNGRLKKLGVSREIKRRVLRPGTSTSDPRRTAAPKDAHHHPGWALAVYERHIPLSTSDTWSVYQRHIRSLFFSFLSFL